MLYVASGSEPPSSPPLVRTSWCSLVMGAGSFKVRGKFEPFCVAVHTGEPLAR